MRGVAGSASILQKNKCQRCGTAWKQDAQFCRRCSRGNHPMSETRRQAAMIRRFLTAAYLRGRMLKDSNLLRTANDALAALDAIVAKAEDRA